MVMIYLLFAMSIIFIRILSGHDSRYESGKYLTVQNTILSKLLMDNTSLKKTEAGCPFAALGFMPAQESSCSSILPF